MSVWVYKQLVTFPWQMLWQFNCCASLTTVVFPSGVATFVVLTVLITEKKIGWLVRLQKRVGLKLLLRLPSLQVTHVQLYWLIYLLQNKPISALYGEVRKVTGKQVIVLVSGEDLIEENNSQLQSEIFDGVKLTLSTTITLFVVVDKQYTIHISSVSSKMFIC